METDDEVKNRAYRIGLSLKNEGWDEEVIYARLEKQGFPEELARQVAKNVRIQRVKEQDKENEPFLNIALIRIGVALLITIISAFIFQGNIILPIGMLVTGIIFTLIYKKKS